VELRLRLKELAKQRRRFGCKRLYLLLRQESFEVNHKGAERLYRQEGLSLRKRKKKRPSHCRLVLTKATRADQHLAMDFASDSLYDGRRFRALTILHQYTREAIAIEVSNSITGHHVCRVLDWIGGLRSVPEAITVDHGPEFTSTVIDRWAFS